MIFLKYFINSVQLNLSIKENICSSHYSTRDLSNDVDHLEGEGESEYQLNLSCTRKAKRNSKSIIDFDFIYLRIPPLFLRYNFEKKIVFVFVFYEEAMCWSFV
jgi:hypothetical protein